MQSPVALPLLLILFSPLLVHTRKVVFVVPGRHVRRSHAIRAHNNYNAIPLSKKPISLGNRFLHTHEEIYENADAFYPVKGKRYNQAPFPHGGDDFDQGSEEASHHVIPHGKDITHGVSFGKGYIPYEAVQEYFSMGNVDDEYVINANEYPASISSYDASARAYAPSSAVSDYPQPQLHSTRESDSYFSVNSDDDSKNGFQERSKDVATLHPTASIDETRSVVQLPRESAHNAVAEDSAIFAKTQAILDQNNGRPRRIPDDTHRGGFVVRDTVALEEYNKKIEELTKTWPGPPNFPLNSASSSKNTLPFLNRPVANFPSSYSWSDEFPRAEKGYAVKEDTMENPPDFRIMPIVTSPLQPVPILPSWPTTLYRYN